MMEKVEVKKNEITKEVFNVLSERIMKSETLEEIYEIGKELTSFELNSFKRALLILYKDKKKEIIRNKLNENTIFSNLYYMIITSDEKVMKNIGKLLYNIKNTNILTKEELNELFEVYERQKEKTKNNELDNN